MTAKPNENWVRTLTLIAGAAIVAASSTGCQVSVNGQTLPSGYYLEDDVQYFPGKGDFKLSEEAAQLAAERAEEKLQGRR
jgi:hypothetical protein